MKHLSYCNHWATSGILGRYFHSQNYHKINLHHFRVKLKTINSNRWPFLREAPFYSNLTEADDREVLMNSWGGPWCWVIQHRINWALAEASHVWIPVNSELGELHIPIITGDYSHNYTADDCLQAQLNKTHPRTKQGKKWSPPEEVWIPWDAMDGWN